MERLRSLRFQRPQLWVVGRILLGLVLIGFGIEMIAREVRYARELPASRNWPHVYGMVVANHGVQEPPRRGPTLRVSYEYTVKGQRFTSRRLWVHGSSGASPELQEFRRHLLVGTEVQVYYDPQRPERAALYPGVPDTQLPWAPATLLVIAAALGIGVWSAVQAITRSGTVYRHRR